MPAFKDTISQPQPQPTREEQRAKVRKYKSMLLPFNERCRVARVRKI